MPIIKSAKKSVRKNATRKERNLLKKKDLKKKIKDLKSLVASNKLDEAKKSLPQVYKTIDKSAKSGIIKKNTAARKKSRITKLITKK